MSTPDAVLLGADQLAQLECIALGLLPAWLELPVELLAGRSEVALRDREGVTVARWHAVGAAIPAAGGAVRGGNVQLADTPTSATYRGLRLAPDRVRAGLGAGSVTAVVGVHAPSAQAMTDVLDGAGPVLLLAAAGGARSDDAAHHRRIRGWQQLADRLATRDAVLVLTPLWPGAPAEAVVAAARAYGADEVIRGDELPPELERQGPGATVLLTGLSGSGKSTIAAELVALLTEDRERTVTLLDGDVVRTHLSSELGFSRAHRDLNVLRIGWVAAEITKHGGLAVCAPIAPYAGTRQTVREMVEAQGGPGAFVLVYVATPLAECERRDRKGLYAQARAGTIAEFTGVSDPYDEPVDADLVIDTTEVSAVVAAQRIVGLLAARNRL